MLRPFERWSLWRRGRNSVNDRFWGFSVRPTLKSKVFIMVSSARRRQESERESWLVRCCCDAHTTRPMAKTVVATAGSVVPRDDEHNVDSSSSMDAHNANTSSNSSTSASPQVAPITFERACHTSTKPHQRQQQRRCRRRDAAFLERKRLLERQRHAVMEKRRLEERKKAIKHMHTQAQELQRIYEQLCQEADEKRSVQLDARHCASSSQASEQHEILRLLRSIDRPNWSLHRLAKEIHRLQDSNAALRELLEQHEHFQHLIRAGMADFDPLMVARPIHSSRCQWWHQLSCGAGHLGGRFVYFPFSEEECFARIRDDYEQHFCHRHHFAADKSDRFFPFQWRGFMNIEQRALIRFHLTKWWPSNTDQVFDNLWRVMTTGISGRVVGNTMPACTRLLQRVSDDIMIFRRWRKSPSLDAEGSGSDQWLHHSVFMLYRMRVNTSSYMVGVIPVPLWGSGPSAFEDDPYGKRFLHERETLVLARCYFLLESVGCKSSSQDEDGDHPTRTRVTRWGMTSCETPEYAALLASEILEGLLRFEYLVLFPFVQKQIDWNQ